MQLSSERNTSINMQQKKSGAGPNKLGPSLYYAELKSLLFSIAVAQQIVAEPVEFLYLKAA